MERQYIIRKYVIAKSASDAIKLDSKTPEYLIWIFNNENEVYNKPLEE